MAELLCAVRKYIFDSAERCPNAKAQWKAEPWDYKENEAFVTLCKRGTLVTVVDEMWIRFSTTSEDFLVCVCVDNDEDRWQDIGSCIADVCKLRRSQSDESRSR